MAFLLSSWTMSEKIYNYLLFFGLITISAASFFNCSVAVPSIMCTCNDKMKEIKCIGTEADQGNNNVASAVNNILLSSNISIISVVHIESPKMQINATILFPNTTIETLTIINSDLKELDELALSNLKELESLSLTNNAFTAIPAKGLQHLSALQTLELSHNRIQHVYVDDLRNLSSLKNLYLDHNVISVIDDGSFSSLINLYSLHLKNNTLSLLRKDMFKGLISLVIFDVSTNSLTNLSKDLLSHMPHLKAIIAENNNFASLKNIEATSLSLEKLSLENSSINGPLEFGLLEGLPNLTSLFLGKNPIGSVSSYAFSHMQNMNTLKLDFCEIDDLDKTAFHNLTKLSMLDLSNNRLREFTCSHTLYLESLKDINLENNQLKTIGKGTFVYSNSLDEIRMEGNKLLCNCDLASFAEVLRDKKIDLDDFDCNDGSTMADIDFTGMNCADNTSMCTKAKQVTNFPKVALNTSSLQFTIKFGQITQNDDTLGVNYRISTNSSLSDNDFNCSIASKHLSEVGFQEFPTSCGFNMQEQYIDIAVLEEVGNYNVCISVHYHEDTLSVECTTIEHTSDTTTTEQYTTDPTTSTKTEEVTDYTEITSTKAGEVTDLPKVDLGTSCSQFTTKFGQITQNDVTLSVNYFINKSNSLPDYDFNCSLSTKYMNDFQEFKLDCSFNKQEQYDIALKEVGNYNVCMSIHYHDNACSVECTAVEHTRLDTTTSNLSDTSVTTTHTTAVLIYTDKNISSSVTENASLSSTYLASTVTEVTLPSTITMQQYTIGPTVITSHKTPSVKSFSIEKDAKEQLWLSWNMTLEYPKTICVLKFFVLLHNQPRRNWQMECKNGSYFLGDIKATHPYQICIEMYMQKKLVETNCTEIAPLFMLSAASSKSTGLTAKLPIAAFIALIILAVVILILIIIVLIKLLYLKKNKTNTYYVAKEEVDNQNRISKRSSTLYSVSSVEDDQV